ncbi:unnamed protein product [Clavelina lepadiformis]|uniref:Uncharacterized protein n=1 Tax=Clavelina lepadiformis TaxID=159417 RepID=A0ABP0GE01_CLALP
MQNFRRLRAAGVPLFNPACWTCSACRPAKRFVAGEPICKPTPKAAQALAIPLPSPLLRHITARQIGAEHGNATQFTQNEDFKLGHTQKTFKLFCLALLYTLHTIDEGSSFDIIKQLKLKKIIDGETAHLLSYAIALSRQVRLEVYIKKNSHHDYIGEGQLYDSWDNTVFKNLVELTGERSSVDYFLIAGKLQQALQREKLC